MEVNITRFVESAEPFEFSSSIAERGQNAGPETWHNAKREAASAPLLTAEDELEEFREYIAGFGAWDDEEIAAMSDTDLNALLIQLISGDIREAGLDACDPEDFDWVRYEQEQEEGRISGNLYRGNDGQIYYYVGS